MTGRHARVGRNGYKLLIEQWAKQGIQEQLEGLKRVYARLSSELAKHGVEKTGEQCRNKVKKLHHVYKKLKIIITRQAQGGRSGSFMRD